MRYEARVTAYDMLDQVTVVLCVYSTADQVEGGSQLVLQRGTTVQGTGELDPTEWARDALVAALETL